jgi:outer membrane protein insertion porin family
MAFFKKSGHFNVIILLITGGFLFCGCNVTKHLDQSKNEFLLTKNSLVLQSPKRLSLGAKTDLQYAMGGLYKQQPNRKLLGMRPRLAAHYKFRTKTGKFARWVNSKYAEPPTIYNADLAERSSDNLENFLRQRGYFNAKCTYETTFGSKTAHTKYVVDMGPRHTVRSVNMISKDTALLRVLMSHNSESQIKPGGPMDGRDFDAERVRINTLLRNNGYARFVPNFIDITGDSTGTETDVTIEIFPQTDTTMHQVFYVDDVTVFYGLEPNLIAIKSTDKIDSIDFYSSERQFFIKPKYLAPFIMTKPGQLYKQEDFERTNRNLSRLGVFRFVKVRPTISATDSVGLLDSEIAFAPVKKYEYGFTPDFNYTTGGLIGIAANAFFENRNLAQGGERWRIALQGNREFDIQSTSGSPIFSSEVKFTNTLTLPRFVDYLGLWHGLSKIRIGNKKLLDPDFYEHLKFDNQTLVSANYNFLYLNNFYRYELFNANFGYQLVADRQRSWQITHLGVDFLRAELDSAFEARFASNPLILRQFDDQLFTGFLLRNLGYVWNSKPNRAGERFELRFNSELSGLEVHLVERLFGSSDSDWQIDSVDFAKFLRLETGGKYTRNFTKDLFAGIRVSTGILLPFGGAKTTTPYVKQFFLGGPSSIRAWRIRELGPGTFEDLTINRDSNQPFFQASDFKFEFNAEVRFPLFWWFKGAIFLDGGNIWSLKKDTARPGSQLTAQSFRDLALGTGAGIRFDFGYSQIRLDLGLQLRRPYQGTEPGGSRWVKWDPDDFKNWSAWNLAVGYPF